MERGAEARFGHDPHVDLDPAREYHAGAGGAAREHLLHLRIGREALHHRSARFCRHEDIDVADGLLHAAQAAGDHHLPDAFRAAQMFGEGMRILRRKRELEALRLGQMRLDAPEEVLLGLLAEPCERADPALLRRLVQLRQRVDSEVVIKRLDALRSQAGYVQQFGDPGGQLLLEPLEQPAGSRLDDLADLAGEVFTDPGQLRQRLAGLERRRDVEPQVAYGPRRVAIGADAERIGLLDLEEIGDVLEHPGDVGIVDGHGIISIHARKGHSDPSQPTVTVRFSRS